jgi:hypothetical protein
MMPAGSNITKERESDISRGIAMPMDFLRRIEEASFPLAVLEEADIQCAAVLAAANFIEARLPDPGERLKRSALILRITPLGRAELARLRQQRA